MYCITIKTYLLQKGLYSIYLHVLPGVNTDKNGCGPNLNFSFSNTLCLFSLSTGID